MRLVIPLVVAIVVAACALQQSGSGLSLVRGEGARSAQVALDAEAILQGMAQARSANERLAGDNRRFAPGAAEPALTR
jgi:hypothetical protein